MISVVNGFIHFFEIISGSNVYPGESSFIFQSKNLAVINANNLLKPLFNSSYISTKGVSIKVPPVA